MSEKIDRIVNIAGIIAGGLIIGMVLLVTATSAGRYFFDSPIKGANEIVALCLGAIVFLSLGITEREGRHIRVNVLSSRFSVSSRLVIDCGGSLMSIAMMIIMAWRIMVLARVNWTNGTLSLVLDVPLYVILLIMGIGVVIAILAFSLHLFDYLKELKRRKLLVWLVPISMVILLVLMMPLLSGSWEVDKVTLGISGLLLMFLLLLLGLPVAVVMLLIGYVGVSCLCGLSAGLNMVAMVPYSNVTEYGWIVLPLFVLMGNIVGEAKFAQDVYNTANAFLGRFPGGLAMATVGACAGFAAACGDSLSTAVTIGSVALPEMRRYKYDPKLATGTVAAGGTLGILIPPSLGFIVYGIITEQSIGALFMAGIFPGIMLALLFIFTIYFLAQKGPSPAVSGSSLREKIISLKGSLPILALFISVIGGIYIGIFTPIEAGAVGAFMAILIALIMRRLLSWQAFGRAVKNAVILNNAVFFIFIGAMVLGHFITVSNIPMIVSDIFITLPIGRWGVLGLVLLMYIILGCIMNIIPAMIITLPMVFPALLALGFDPIWLGVVMVITMEMGQITPPVGINVYGIASVAPDVPMGSIFKGILPFFLMMLLAIGILVLFPDIATILPNTMR